MRNRRTRRFIDSTVQGALVRRIVLHWLIFLAMAFFTLPLWQIWSSGNIFRPFSTLMVESWRNTAPVFVILIAMLPIFVWDTVKLSHRFAGPMYRFQNTVKSLVAGKCVRPISLRDGDFWTEFADDLNALMRRIDDRKESAPVEADAVGCGDAGDPGESRSF
jgi:hypothetical protein